MTSGAAATSPAGLPVHVIAREIAARRLSPVDLVEDCLARIARLEPRLHSFVAVHAAEARLAAEAADKAIRSGHAVGPLHGIPVALKDLIEIEGKVATGGSAVEVVRRPEDGDWTAALLAAIGRPGAPPVGLASFSSVHWSDGGAVDLAPVAAALRAQGGAALLVDATHGAGVMRLDVAALDPDFLVFPTYKWVLGPYGRAFLYVARRRQGGVPLEQTGHGRRAVTSERRPYLRDTGFADGARRFDMGERDHLVSLEMASVGMEMMAAWGPEAITGRLRMLTDRLADGLADGLRGTGGGVRFGAARVRAPHVLSLDFPGGMPEGLIERLAAEGVHVAPRLGRIRISPHVYNDEADVDRFLDTFRRLTAGVLRPGRA